MRDNVRLGGILRRGPNSDMFVMILLIVVGTIFCYQLTIKPILATRAAKNWQETPCKIMDSQIDTLGNRHNYYRVNIIYNYSFEGQKYQGNKYNFSNSSPSYNSQAVIAKRYPTGSTQVCYVNPNAPEEAVLRPDYDTDYLWEGMPIAVLLMGVIGLLRIRAGMGV